MNIFASSSANMFSFLPQQGVDFVWLAIKWMAVLGILMYCLFAAVIIKQVSIMAQTIDDPANGSVRVIAWAHFALALVCAAMMIVIL